MKKIYIIKYRNDLENINIENNYLIICLSLESYKFYKTRYKNTKHINEFANFDKIYLESYEKTSKIKIFNEEIWNHLIVNCFGSKIPIYFDYFFSELISEQIIKKFNKQDNIFFIPKILPHITSIFNDNHQKTYKKSYLFFLIFKQILIINKYKIIDDNLDLTKLIEKNELLVKNKINWQIKTDLSYKGNNNINKQISKLKKCDIIIDHWGIDIHRLLDYNTINNLLIKNKIKTTNICYRTHKIKNFINYDNKIISTLKIDELIFKGQTYGINLSEFNNKEIKYIVNKYTDFYNKLQKDINFKNIFLDNIINLHIFYMARFYCIKKLLFNKIIQQTSPKVYFGSDIDHINFQISKFICKENNIKTVSFPHSPKIYIHNKELYIHHNINTYNTYNCKYISEHEYKLKSHVVGLSNIGYKSKIFQTKNKYNIVFGTRSWGGFYNNISFIPKVYNDEFNSLLKKLENNKYNTIIKSHPNGDITDYYDLIIKDYKNVQHISKGWKYDIFLNTTDVLVLFELPSFFIYALFSNIPIVLITGTMTKILKEQLHYPIDLFPCVETSQEAFAMIENITTNNKYRYDHLKKQQIFLEKNIAINPENNLINIILQNI